MTIKKAAAVILIMALCITSLAACAGNGDMASGTEQDSTSASQAPTTQEDNSFKADYLPDVNYDGYEFRMVTVANGTYDLITTANITDETGEVVNDAIYKRNRLVEDRYGIKIKQIDVADYQAMTDTFKKSTTAGSDDFDLCMLISRDAWATALTGAVLPVKDLPYLDVTQPWYAQDVNSEITIGGELYFAYSDECLNMFEQTMLITFNKQIAQDLELDDLYTTVKDGSWTQDKFFQYAKAAVADLDGDGTMSDTDRYGILSMSDFFYPTFWVSSGIKTVSKDDNDLLTFTGTDEKLFTVLENVYQNIFGGEKIFFDVWNDKITSYTYVKGTEDQRKVSRMQFENNLGLFFVVNLGIIPVMRGMETDFGILPFPKADESQDKYYSRVIDGWINCVPVTASDPSRTSVIMEALAVESRNITIPAYFETALRTKYARDDESQEMLDIIYAGRTMDLGDTFYMDPIRNIFVNVLVGKKNNFASAVEAKTPAVEKALKKANDAAALLK